MKIRHDTPGIALAAALGIARAAVEEAERRGVRINVAVVDGGGNSVAFLRMPGSFLHSADLATDKAYTAASFGFPTEQWPVLMGESRILWAGVPVRDRLVVLAGGIPIIADGECIGGVGVSGGSEAEDVACAMAGLSALGLAPA